MFKYYYMLCYHANNGTKMGNEVIIRRSKLKTWDDIVKLKEFLCKENEFINVQFTSITLLHKKLFFFKD